MNRTEYLSKINAGGVYHANVVWQTTVKPAAAHAHRTLTKVSGAVVMTGADYSGLAVNAGKETGSLPWGEWAEYPHIVAHKGKEYARLYVVDGTIHTVYMVDGEVVEQEEFFNLLTPSARNAKKPNGGCITVTLDNVKKITAL